VLRVDESEVSKYGIIQADPVDEHLYRVRAIIEKPVPAQAPSRLAQVHAWILPPRIFELLADTPPGKDGEIWLADAITRPLDETPVHAVEIEGYGYDTGNKQEFLRATVDFALLDPDLGPPFREYLRTVLACEST